MIKEYKLYLFKFKKYPELLEMYKVYRKMCLNSTKYSMKESAKAAEKMKKAIADEEKYCHTIFAKAIYEIFNKKKPVLHSLLKDGNYIKWDDFFGERQYDELTNYEKDCLVGLIGKSFNYELPKKYYNRGRGLK